MQHIILNLCDTNFSKMRKKNYVIGEIAPNHLHQNVI
jgi:hypothetical protein